MKTNNLCLIVLSLLLVACANNPSNVSTSGTYGAAAEDVDTSRARAHTDLGAAYFQQGKYEIALEEFNEALKNSPNYALAYNGLGLVYGAIGENAQADSNFKKALQLDAGNSESHNNYGGFLCAQQRYDESIQQFMAAVKNPLYATPSIAYTNAGICSARKGDTKVAEAYLQRALKIDPLMGMAALQLAKLQMSSGHMMEAKQSLQNVVIANPNPEILWMLVLISRGLADKNAESSYALQLRKQFPDAEQTKLLLNGQ